MSIDYKNEKEELDHIKLLLSSFQIGIWKYNIKTDLLCWDQTQYKVYEVPEDSTINNFSTWANLVDEEDLLIIQEKFNKCLNSPDKILEYSFRIKLADNSFRHLRSRAIINRDTNGVAESIIGINYDITNFIKREDRLIMLEALVEASPDIFGIATSKGEMIFLNKTARNFGWSEEKSFGDIFPIESVTQYVNDIFPVLKSSGRWDGEVLFKDGNTGEEFPVRQQSFLLKDNQSETIVATIATDIRTQKEMELELSQQRLKLIQSAKMTSLGEMASGMSHEINNPLAIIKGNIALLQSLEKDTSPDKNQIYKSLATIDQTVDRIAGIIKSLQSFARDGALEKSTELYISTLIKNTLIFYRNRISNAGIILNIDCEESDLIIIGKQAQLNQALANLVSNAFEAALYSSYPEIMIQAIQDKTSVLIKVIDSGAGVPTEFQEKIFEPFFTTRKVGEGTGLGLAVAKGHVEDNNGRLYLDTSAQKTTFVIELPLIL